MRELLPYLALAVSVLACVIAILTFIRAGRWRDSDVAKALLDRVDSAESRLDRLETRTDAMPTKADLEALKGEVHSLGSQINDQVVPGLRRIEDYFISEGMKGKG